MFKQFFIDLTNINSTISLQNLRLFGKYARLNWTTVRIYHQLHGTGK